MDDSEEDDLFSLKTKLRTAPAQRQSRANEGAKKGSTVSEHHDNPERRTGTNKDSFTSAALDDSPFDLLDDLRLDETEPEPKPRPEKSLSSASPSPVLKKETSKASKKDVLDFNDDSNDIINMLGFDLDVNPKRKEAPLLSSKEKSDAPQRPRTRIDDILKDFTSPHLPDRPPTGERKDPVLPQEKQQQQGKSLSTKETLLDDDVTFESYQPSIVSTPEGRQSRRQSVRFFTEDFSISSPEKKPKPTTPTASRHRNMADWLGLKTNDEPDLLEDGPKESPKIPSSPVLEGKTSLTESQPTSLPEMTPDAEIDSKQSKPEPPTVQRRSHDEEDDWLTEALSRKKAAQEAKAFGIDSAVSKQVTSQTPRDKEDTTSSVKGSSPAAHSTPVREKRPHQAVPQQSQTQSLSASVQKQVSFSADNLQQQLLLQQQQQLLREESVADADVLQKPHGDYQALQARIIELEGQVRKLQLERDQSQMMLESLQQRHKQDLDLLENSHKTRVKLLEESAAQRETRARLEYEELLERLAALTRSAEQERAELQAQYHRKLGLAQQDRDREVERLRELQRKSVLEMTKDHEDQLQRLKKLKDEEIDAVTSATSQTRSLTGVIGQMEQFSSRLGDLTSRVESTYEHAAHDLEQGARHRDEQLQKMQERLTQQQKAMEEERAYLKDIISRMDSQLSEQQRELEKERWKVTAEKAKVESTQRSLEEERRVLTMQISVEREELERAKSALVEEQKSVMQHCVEERRKLADEWAHFHAQQKQRHERAEREVNSLLEKKESSIMSLAQEQADLKLRTAELKQKEVAVAQERETLDRLREELDGEKERMRSTALRLKTRAQEVEAFSKLAAETHEEGERALREAKRLEAGHEGRLIKIQSQTQHLRQLEQRNLQERVRLNHLCEDLEKTRQNSSMSPLSQNIPPVSPDPVLVLPDLELPTWQHIPPSHSSTSNRSMMLEASLALWRYSGEKDREFLEEEELYLENLKKDRLFQG